jgi:hypothetical protein
MRTQMCMPSWCLLIMSLRVLLVVCHGQRFLWWVCVFHQQNPSAWPVDATMPLLPIHRKDWRGGGSTVLLKCT